MCFGNALVRKKTVMREREREQTVCRREASSVCVQLDKESGGHGSSTPLRLKLTQFFAELSIGLACCVLLCLVITCRLRVSRRRRHRLRLLISMPDR